MAILKKKGDIMETSALYEMIKLNLSASFGKVDVCLIDAVLDIFDELVKGEEKYIGLTKWKIFNPSTSKRQSYLRFQERKRIQFTSWNLPIRFPIFKKLNGIKTGITK